MNISSIISDMTMQAKFSFFKAGQGAFYGGYIVSKSSGHMANVVYDCGALRQVQGSYASLETEIDSFAAELRARRIELTIDVLFLSHLDYDHVSGLKKLTELFKIDRVVLPYIDERDRLVAVFSYDSEAPLGSTEMSFVEYFDFLEKPHDYFISKNESCEIYYIDSQSPASEYQNYSEVPEDGPIQVVGFELGLDGSEFAGVGPGVHLFANCFQIFVDKRWEFATYCVPVDKTKQRKLVACLKKILNKRRAQRLLVGDLRNIASQHRAEAHKCYANNIGNINHHGLILLHSPVGYTHYAACEIVQRISDDNVPLDLLSVFDSVCVPSVGRKFLGALLLGDTSMNGKKSKIILPNYFKDRLPFTYLIQIPHHGSRRSWNYDELLSYYLGSQLSRCGLDYVGVCNYGIGNTYGHPYPKILKQLGVRYIRNDQTSRCESYYCIQ